MGRPLLEAVALSPRRPPTSLLMPRRRPAADAHDRAALHHLPPAAAGRWGRGWQQQRRQRRRLGPRHGLHLGRGSAAPGGASRQLHALRGLLIFIWGPCLLASRSSFPVAATRRCPAHIVCLACLCLRLQGKQYGEVSLGSAEGTVSCALNVSCRPWRLGEAGAQRHFVVSALPPFLYFHFPHPVPRSAAKLCRPRPSRAGHRVGPGLRDAPGRAAAVLRAVRGGCHQAGPGPG